jgi:hypothetical protein
MQRKKKNLNFINRRDKSRLSKMSIELQNIDCNCNNCKFMVRNSPKRIQHMATYKGTGLMDDLQFGDCSKFNKPVSFIPNTCQVDTQDCFENRKNTFVVE